MMTIEEKVRTSFNLQKFMTYLGAELRKVNEGYCEIALTFNDELTQQDGFFHAGVIGTIADTAAGYAAYTLMGPNESVLSVEYKLNLLRPAKGDLLIAKSKVLKHGKTLTVCNAEVYVKSIDGEVLCASATVTLIAISKTDSK